MQITNGTVEYGRTVKPADYESKTARVALTFAVEEGATEEQVWQITSRIADRVQAEVHSRLGIGPVSASVGAPATATTPSASKRQSKAPPKTVTEIPAPSASDQPGAGNTGVGASVVDIVDPTVAAVPSASQEPATAASIIVDAPEAASSSVEIKDTDLHAAVHAALEHKVSSQVIKALVAEFTGAPGASMKLIPQEKRAEFIERLKAA